MEKRVLLAVVLSFVVLYGYQALFPPPKPADKPADEPAAAPSRRPRTGPRQPASPRRRPEAARLSRRRGGEAPRSSPTPRSGTSRSRSESVRAVFTTRGGALKSWRLKKYQDAARQPLELVPHTVPPGTLRPFTLSVAGPGA